MMGRPERTRQPRDVKECHQGSKLQPRQMSRLKKRGHYVGALGRLGRRVQIRGLNGGSYAESKGKEGHF